MASVVRGSPDQRARGRADEAQPHAGRRGAGDPGLVWPLGDHPRASLPRSRTTRSTWSSLANLLSARGWPISRASCFWSPLSPLRSRWRCGPANLNLSSLACPALYAHFCGGRFHSHPPAPLFARHVSALILVVGGLPLCRRPRIVLVEHGGAARRGTHICVGTTHHRAMAQHRICRTRADRAQFRRPGNSSLARCLRFRRSMVRPRSPLGDSLRR